MHVPQPLLFPTTHTAQGHSLTLESGLVVHAEAGAPSRAEPNLAVNNRGTATPAHREGAGTGTDCFILTVSRKGKSVFGLGFWFSFRSWTRRAERSLLAAIGGSYGMRGSNPGLPHTRQVLSSLYFCSSPKTLVFWVVFEPHSILLRAYSRLFPQKTLLAGFEYHTRCQGSNSNLLHVRRQASYPLYYLPNP